MLNLLAILMLLFSPDPQGSPSGARIERVPDGTVAKGVYLNSAIDVSFQIHENWTATLIPGGSVQFAPERPVGDAVNRCSRALFASEPSHAESKPFGPKATFFVIDPECFPGAPFPKSTKDRKAVAAERAVRAFTGTPYISKRGADFGGVDVGKRVFVTLVGDKNVNTVHVNMMLMITESKGYWVVIAEMVDDTSKGIMEAGGFDVTERR